MQEHPSSEQLKLYHRRALAPGLFLSIHRHVSACPVCSEQWSAAPFGVKEDYETLLAALMPAPDDEAYHLTRAEMAGYVRGNLDEVSIETADSHLEVCAECMQAVEQLHVAAAAAAADSFAPGAEAIGGKQQNYGQHTRAGFMAFLTAARHRPAQFASVLLLVFGLVLATMLFIRSRDSQPAQPSTARVESANPNANIRDTLPSNSQTGSPRIADESAAGINGEQNPSQAGEEKSRDDLTAVAPGFNEGGSGVGVEQLSPSSRQAIKLALTRQRLERPQVLAELNGARGTLLSESGDGLPFHLLSPLGKVLQSSAPTFRWKPLDGAGSYVVTVTDDQFNEVATSGPLTKTEWTSPTPLKRGGVYSWQVTAFKDGKEVISPVMPAPQARFKILDQAHYEELNRVKRAFPNYHLALGVLYTRAGLLDEAEREFQALLKATPRSAVARKLLDSVRAMKK